MGSRRQHLFVLLFVLALVASRGSSSPPRKRSSASTCRAASSWSTKASRPAPRPKSPVKTSKTRSTSSKSGSTTSACPRRKSRDSATRTSPSACPASPTRTAPPNRWGRPRSSSSTTGSRTCSARSGSSAATRASRRPPRRPKNSKKNGKRRGATPKSFESKILMASGAYPNAYQAALLAEKQKPKTKAECEKCSVAKPRFYLFEDNAKHKLLAGPELSEKDLYETPTGETLSKNGTTVVEIPAGTVLVSELPTDESGKLDETAAARLVRAERRIRAVGQRNHRTEAGIRRRTRRTERRLQIHRPGSGKLPERHPQDRPARPVAGDRPANRTAAARSGHFAVILDNEVQSRPIINFQENPDGIDGRQGAQISGGFSGEHGLETAAGTGDDAADRRAADRTAPDLGDAGLGDPRLAGPPRRHQGRDHRPRPRRHLPARLLPLPRPDLDRSRWPPTG